MDINDIINRYNPNTPLFDASTIPAAWYLDQRIFDLEQRAVFGRSWQMVARADQLSEPGQYVTCEIGGEPILLVRGSDGLLRGFFNVCRHHAAAVLTEVEGTAHNLRCPYHGWTYALDGKLIGTPDFGGVCNFDREANGLASIEVAAWENWVFATLEPKGSTLHESLGSDLIERCKPLRLDELHWMERRSYTLECNWKVFVDNYLDGGYHVPHLHKGLDSVLDYSEYTIENGERFCLQSSPMAKTGAEAQTGEVRKGERAFYFWIYPNLMINWYEGVMDTNLVIPLAVDRTEVIFDFYFADNSEQARKRNLASIEVGQRIQDEDVAI